MVQVHEIIADPLKGPVGRHIASIRAIPYWTAEKKQLVAELTSQLTRRHYIHFHAHYQEVLLQRLGIGGVGPPRVRGVAKEITHLLERRDNLYATTPDGEDDAGAALAG